MRIYHMARFLKILICSFGRMAADHLAHIEVAYDNGYEKHQVIPECDMPKDVLSDEGKECA